MKKVGEREHTKKSIAFVIILNVLRLHAVITRGTRAAATEGNTTDTEKEEEAEQENKNRVIKSNQFMSKLTRSRIDFVICARQFLP